MHRARVFSLVCAGLLGLPLPRTAGAAWPTDPAVNVPLCTAACDQISPCSVPDGTGGAIVIWSDPRSGGYKLYSQEVSSNGTIQWTANGVAVCPETAGQYRPAAVSDGAGGAIVAWEDARGGGSDVYAQKVAAGGAIQWTTSGVPLRTAVDGQNAFAIASDGAGGAIVAWQDFRSGNYDIYAQRISADGTVQWTANGVALCTAAGEQQNIRSVTDGAGGAIATWADWRNGNWDVYAQRISAGGTIQWTADGAPLCTNADSQFDPAIVADGAGGAVVAWTDWRAGQGCYAQRISGAGAVQWSTNGVAVRTGFGPTPSIASDGGGGAIIGFTTQVSAGAMLYAQHVSAAGMLQWDVLAVVVCVSATMDWVPTIVEDGEGGAIVAWVDYRAGYYSSDIYAQRVNRNGLLGGLPSDEVPLDAPLAFALDPVRPNPSRGGALTVHFSLPTAATARLELLDVAGRCIVSREVGAGQHTLDLGAGQQLAPGLYLVRLTQGARTRTTRTAVLR